MNPLRQLKRRLSLWSYELSCKSRQKKFDLFWEVIRPAPGSLMLNLGAVPPILGKKHYGQDSTGVEQPEQDERFRTLRIVACDLLPKNMRGYESCYRELGWHGFVADGCQLPFPDKSIDIVFSNAVIEHVSRRDQQRMASEIMRVGRSWFVTTPNYWYPLELHRKLPGFHYLPGGGQRWLDRRFDLLPDGELIINLLSARSFLKLFPEVVCVGCALLSGRKHWLSTDRAGRRA